MLIESLRWRQREPSIHEENSPRQDRVITNKKTGLPAFGYPAKDQRKLAAELTVYEHARAR